VPNPSPRLIASSSVWLVLAGGVLLGVCAVAIVQLSGQEDIQWRELGLLGIGATTLVVVGGLALALVATARLRWLSLVLSLLSIGMLLVPTTYWWQRRFPWTELVAPLAGPSRYWQWFTSLPLAVPGMAAVLMATPLLLVAAGLLIREGRHHAGADAAPAGIPQTTDV
jgi:hypothetical protein